ncbi:MAG: hypothetical protein V1742_02805 [Pseudomonadota bacterium]
MGGIVKVVTGLIGGLLGVEQPPSLPVLPPAPAVPVYQGPSPEELKQQRLETERLEREKTAAEANLAEQKRQFEGEKIRQAEEEAKRLAEEDERKRREEKRLALAFSTGGRTILTSGLGVTEEAPLGRKKLLGG